MQQSFSRSSLVPSGFVGESAYQDGDRAPSHVPLQRFRYVPTLVEAREIS